MMDNTISIQEFRSGSVCVTIHRVQEEPRCIKSRMYDEPSLTSLRRIARLVSKSAKRTTSGKVGKWQVWMNADLD
jgi:hypothetical protein